MNNYIQMFIIKDYDGHSLKSYIMPQFHEEINGIDGVNDPIFKSENDLKNYFTKKYNKLPDGIIFLWNFSDEIYEKIRSELPNTKIILWADDLHYYSTDAYLKNYKCYTDSDYILSHYDRFKEFYDLDIKEKILHFRNSCSELFLRDHINENSENKIYMYGAVNEHYPDRLYFKKNMEQKYENKFIFKQHPGYSGDLSIFTLDTATELYKYSISYTAGGFPITNLSPAPKIYGVGILGKFFEICGSGLLLLCSHNGLQSEFESIGFKNMNNYIHIDNNNFDEIIEFLFNQSNKDVILQIRKNGYELVKNNHMIKNRLEQINKFLLDKLQ